MRRFIKFNLAFFALDLNMILNLMPNAFKKIKENP